MTRALSPDDAVFVIALSQCHPPLSDALCSLAAFLHAFLALKPKLI
jgi:hypothetical protein